MLLIVLITCTNEYSRRIYALELLILSFIDFKAWLLKQGFYSTKLLTIFNISHEAKSEPLFADKYSVAINN